MDLSKFLQSHNKHQYGVLYVRESEITVLDVFDNETKANNYMNYINQNIKFEGEIGLFKLGESIDLDVDPEKTFDLEDDKQLTSNASSVIEKSKTITKFKKLALRKRKVRNPISIRFSHKGNK